MNNPKDEELNKALKTIDIVDKLIHSITRHHIPDYPETTTAIYEIDRLVQDSNKELLERIEKALDTPEFNYLEAQQVLFDVKEILTKFKEEI